MTFSYQLIAKDGAARLGKVHTAHGAIDTPAFYAGGDRRDGQRHVAAKFAHIGGANLIIQYLPSDVASMRRCLRKIGRAASFYELAGADSNRFGRLSSHVFISFARVG